jgi:hypothetical protein
MKLPKFLFLIPAAILFGAFKDGWPYAYFQALRWATCIFAAVYACQAGDKNRSVPAIVFIGTAILFNPLFPFYMQRDTWLVADGIAGILFVLYGGYSLMKDKKRG